MTEYRPATIRYMYQHSICTIPLLLYPIWPMIKLTPAKIIFINTVSVHVLASVSHKDRDRATPGHDHVSTLYLYISFTFVFHIDRDRVLPYHDHVSTLYLYISFTFVFHIDRDRVLPYHDHVSTPYLYISFTSISHK